MSANSSSWAVWLSRLVDQTPKALASFSPWLPRGGYPGLVNLEQFNAESVDETRGSSPTLSALSLLFTCCSPGLGQPWAGISKRLRRSKKETTGFQRRMITRKNSTSVRPPDEDGSARTEHVRAPPSDAALRRAWLSERQSRTHPRPLV